MNDLLLALYLTDEQTECLVRIFFLWNLNTYEHR
jgi:hypothetical protein